MINKIPKGWLFSKIKGIRTVDQSGTYHLFEYDKLPPIEVKLDEYFEWLSRFPERTPKADWTYDFSTKLINLKKEADQKEIVIPESFYHLMGNGDLLRKIRSNTDCYFELGDHIEYIPEYDIYLIHFLSDSQYCAFWYLCLDRNGNSYVLASGNLYGHIHKEQPFDEVGYYCAASFEEFIFRFWIENEIWYKTQWELEELNTWEQQYIKHYQV